MKRNTVLWSALVVTLVATVWSALTATQAETVAAVSKPSARVASNAPAPASTRSDAGDHVERLLALAPRRIEDDGAEVFRVVAVPVPVPPQAAAVAAPKPTAPPMPWKFVGRMRDAGEVVILLTTGKTDIAAKRGETIGDTYRVEEIGDEAIVLTYLPLGEKQSIPAGDAR